MADLPVLLVEVFRYKGALYLTEDEEALWPPEDHIVTDPAPRLQLA